MSDTESTTPNDPTPEAANSTKNPRDKVIIRMWPKTPILYPMALVALLCGIISFFAHRGDVKLAPVGSGPTTEQTAPAVDGNDVSQSDDAAPIRGRSFIQLRVLDRILAIFFLFFMGFSLFSICVDLDIRWGIIFLAVMIIGALLMILANIYHRFLPGLFGFIADLSPLANSQFYFGIFGVWLLLMVLSYIVTRFHYVRIEPNEVIVYGGLLERQQRYSTIRMRYTKEVQDVMEYYLPLVRSGRLILSFPEQNEAVIIDNVLNVKEKTEQLDNMVGALQITSD